MSVSEKDREHFRRIAEGKAIERAARRREALAMGVEERVTRGLQMGADLPSTPEREAIDRARTLAQAELYVRARRLGLYRP